METATISAKETGRNFLKSISTENVVIHPARKDVGDGNVITLDCAIHTGGEPHLFSIQVKNDALKTAQPLLTRMREIIPVLKNGEVSFAYATIGDKRMFYFPDRYSLYEGDASVVNEVYDIHDDILRKLATVRDLLVACYEKQPQMILLK